MASVVLDTLSFSKSDLDYESNGGVPVILASVSPLQVLDSYLITNAGEKKLYRPMPGNSQIGWEISLLAEKNVIKSINLLIEKQMNLTREFRITKDVSLLSGFLFGVDLDILKVNSARVWLSSFSIGSSFFDRDKKYRARCKLSVAEIE